MSERSETPGRSAAVPWMIRGLAASAAALSGVLLWQSIGGAGVPGCGAGSGCDDVLSSEWSKVLGVPVAAPAVATYAIALAASLHIGAGSPEPRRRGAWLILVGVSVMAALAAAWFTAVQLVSLGVLCKWCTAVHAHGVALAGLVLWGSPCRGRGAAAAAVAGTLAATGLVALQLAFPTPTIRVERGIGAGVAPVPDAVGFLGGRVWLDPKKHPIVGSPDAPVLILDLFDYTCPTCRRMHPFMEAARERYGGRLGIVSLPLPLDPQCNPLMTRFDERHADACELATVAMAVWLVRPEAFGEIHHWLLEGDEHPTPEEALDYAQRLVGVERLAQALLDPAIPDLFRRTAKLFEVSGFPEQGLPRLITSESIVTGRPRTAEELFRLLEAETGLESPAESETPSRTAPQP